ncbi:TOXD protein [Verticillium dahliae VdLs.17]|uniref:TOXD protein n=1 Tax=Verticillium dahliae (strain VdLs.17 / ATCC MYA-4575 / FGSC 10137) TaxID=498257 RepID=G2XCP1_VERDV|nr:TOXD protein [Verticillium dahliae VdLs.17]EGY16759.1 TOXD protein [Verticillium dahliae VdLs.17]KAF3345522.1 Quinidine resistance protein 1 [Verticillium dahliae VDG2]KAH6706873.1 TOXD protein [Verticillium dahliae]
MAVHTQFTPPPTQTAIITQPDLQLGIAKDVPVPRITADNMILIRTRSVALNPSDFKMYAAFPSPGAVDGTDFAGDVVAVGTAVTQWKVGDRVFGAVQGGNPSNHQSGAFQEYVPTFELEVVRIPDSMSYETAASIGGACITTAAVVIYGSLGLRPLPFNKGPEDPATVLVYGGSTASGAMIIQLLKLSGHVPIATCSPHNFELVRSRGAETVFDYHSPTCAADIKSHTNNRLKYAVDCITSPSSVKICHEALGRMGGKYTAIERIPDLPGLRSVVKREWVMGMTMVGRPIDLGKGYTFPVVPEHVKLGFEWRPVCQRLIDEGHLLPHPIRMLAGGWNSILKGLDDLKMQKVSGEKLVSTVC